MSWYPDYSTAVSRLLSWLKRTLNAPPSLEERSPYRDVVERADFPDGEHVKLSCGHLVLIHRYRRTSFPCDQCREEGKP